jgi:molecular chaperone IbpA
MAAMDFTPYRRATVGFDRLFDFLEAGQRIQGQDNYPPFDIERIGADRFEITLAVAGFRPDEIDITSHQNLLAISGRKAEREEDKGRQFVHLGIATRSFERKFELADFVRVENADLKDGLLRIELVREVPEAMKPRKIKLNGQTPLVEGSANDDTAGQSVAA